MIHIVPVEGIANEEVLYLCFLIVKDLGSSVRVLSQAAVRMLIAGYAVKVG